MGIGLMRGRERPQREVLAQVQGGRSRMASAARVPAVNQRQANTVQDKGAMAVPQAARPSSTRIGDLKCDSVLLPIRSDDPDFGLILAAEALAERHGIGVSPKTLRKGMIADGLWQSRAHRPGLRRKALRVDPDRRL